MSCEDSHHRAAVVLAMTPMRSVFFAVVLPAQFALLNLSTRDRHDVRRYPLETLEWRFFFR
jgi:hypothetical protein